MNQRYGEHNGESQQHGQSYRQGPYGQGQHDPQYGQGRFGQSERDREGYGREEHRGEYAGSERYAEGQTGRQGEGQGRRYGEGQRGQGYYSGGRFGEEGGRDYERSAYYGGMSYRDRDPWRGESGRPYARREESGYGGTREGMRGGYGAGWDYGQGGGRYGQQGQYGEERYGERGSESGRGRGRGLLGKLFGRGPKGYKRSDERIKEDICEQLWRSETIDSSEVTITVKEGEVTLTGTVPERWMRHEIENIADESMGVKDIDNNIRIQRQSDETGLEASSAERGTAAAGAGMSTSTTNTKK
jgi:osmotically-inducible protein OsmY